MPENLITVSLASLVDLREAVKRRKIGVPLVLLDLRGRGLDEVTSRRILRVLGSLRHRALVSILETLICERERAELRRARLLWTGPTAKGTAALDTRVQLIKLFESAQQSVFCAGYTFDDPALLRPLYQAMVERGIDVTIVLDIKTEGDGDREGRIHAQVQAFFNDVWLATDPRPTLYVDPRTAAWNPDPERPKGGYFASMHAKAVIVDGQRSILGSANFTSRGTTLNIETGVLLDDASFARALLGQWRALIASEVLRKIE